MHSNRIKIHFFSNALYTHSKKEKKLNFQKHFSGIRNLNAILRSSFKKSVFIENWARLLLRIQQGA